MLFVCTWLTCLKSFKVSPGQVVIKPMVNLTEACFLLIFVNWVFVTVIIFVKKLYYVFCGQTLANKIRYSRWVLTLHIHRPGTLMCQFTKISKNPILSHTARVHKHWCIKPKHELNNLQWLIYVVKGTRYFPLFD